MTQTSNHYTFGENDLAAQRLAYLAAAYERPSREFLSACGIENAATPFASWSRSGRSQPASG
jgi:hypothetical protein